MEEKIKFNLSEITEDNINEMISNPTVYGDLIKNLILEYYHKCLEYAPDKADFDYTDGELFDFTIRSK